MIFRQFVIVAVTLTACNSKLSVSVSSPSRGGSGAVADAVAPTLDSTKITATAVSYSESKLSWTAAKDNLTAAEKLEYYVCSGASADLVKTADKCLAATKEQTWTVNSTSITIKNLSILSPLYFNVIVRDAAGNQAIYESVLQVILIDSAAPKSAGVALSFLVNAVDQSLADITWATAGTDEESGVSKQQIRLFGKNKTTCSGSPDQTIDVSATATSYQWERFSAPTVAGVVRFVIRTIDNAGLFVDSACSAVSLANGVVTFYGPEAGMALTTPSYVDVTGDGIVDMVFANSAYNSNRGYVAVLEGSTKPWTKSLKIYSGENANDYVGASAFVDVTGDGILDIVSGSSLANPGGRAGAGSIYIIPGASSMPNSGLISVVGRRYDGDVAGMGMSVSATSLEDVTGDGIKDIVIGSSGSGPLNGFTNSGFIGVIKGAAVLPASGALLSVGYRYDGDGTEHGVGKGGFKLYDITGDGIKDIIAPYVLSDVGGADSGIIVVIPGAANLPASGFVAAAARRYDGEAAGDRLQASYIQDINGDGLPDIISAYNGAGGGGTGRGSIYVLLGAATLPASGGISVRGIRINGVSNDDGVGGDLKIADITGDGAPEIISANYSADPGARNNAGSLYVIPGGAGFPAASGTIAAVGRRYDGATAGDLFGFATQVCDFTGDGVQDLIAEALDETSGNGAVYVFAGGALAANGNASTVATRRYTGGSGDRAGWGGVSCMDLNSDGRLDLLAVSSQGPSNGISNAGNINLIFGAAVLPASGAFATVGRRYTGATADDYFGDSLQLIDVTGDGYLDFVSKSAMTPNGATSNAGAVYVIPGGSASGTVSAIGRKYLGEYAFSYLGFGLYTEDVSGDGIKDLIAMTNLCSPGGGNEGCFYVIPGAATLPASGNASVSGKRYDGAAAFPISLLKVGVLDLDQDGKFEVGCVNAGYDANGVSDSGAFFTLGGASGLPNSGVFATVATPALTGTTANQGFAGTISPNFTTGNYAMEDINDDGLKDLLIGSTGTPSDFGYVLGQGNLANMSYVPLASSSWGQGSSIAGTLKFVDVTGDGKKDLVSASSAADLNGLTNNGAFLIVPHEFMQFP